MSTMEFNSRRWLRGRNLALVIGAWFCCTVPACAQTLIASNSISPSAGPAPVPSSSMTAWSAPALRRDGVVGRSASNLEAGFDPHQKWTAVFPESAQHITYIGKVADEFRYLETPFQQTIRAPMGSLSRGRICLGFYGAITSQENMLWGLPGAGNLPAQPVTLTSHPAVVAPNAEGEFGFSVTLHHAGATGRGLGQVLLDGVARLIGRGRG